MIRQLDRDKIIAMREEGHSYKEIADALGITRQQVQTVMSHPKLSKYGKTMKDKIMSKVKKNDKTGCWEWQGCRKKDGYGMFHPVDKPTHAHIVSYRLFILGDGEDCLGDLPPIKSRKDGRSGWDIRHKCNNRQCVNPAHLELGTHKENIEDMKRDGNFKLKPHSTRRIQAKKAAILAYYKRGIKGYGLMSTAVKFKVAPETVRKLVKAALNVRINKK